MNASNLTLNQRFEIIQAWINFKEFRNTEATGIAPSYIKQEYIEIMAKKLNLHEDTVRLVMAEGIVI